MIELYIYIPFNTFDDEIEYDHHQITVEDLEEFLNCKEEAFKYLDLNKIIETEPFKTFIENKYRKSIERDFKKKMKERYDAVISEITLDIQDGADLSDETLQKRISDKIKGHHLHRSQIKSGNRKVKKLMKGRVANGR